MKKNFFEFRQLDRALMGLSLLGILFCSIVLLSEQVYKAIFEENKRAEGSHLIGEITVAKNDIRHRPNSAIAWDKVKSEHPIYSGDSVFTGNDSTSKVQLKLGGEINLEENSMVHFANIDQIEVPNLAFGNFHIKVHGKVKLKVNERIVEVSGTHSVIEISVAKDKKSKITLTEGTASLSTNKKETPLPLQQTVLLKPTPPVTDRTIAQEQVDARPEKLENTPEEFIEFPQVSTSEPSEVVDGIDDPSRAQEKNGIELLSAPQNVTHTFELEDLFKIESEKLIRRTEAKKIVTRAIEISWKTQEAKKEILGQLSDSPRFEYILDSFKSSDDKGQFNKIHIGENFYRLSLDGKNWTEPQKFEVKAKYLEMAPPKLIMEKVEPKTSAYPVEVKIPIASPFPQSIVEISKSKDFPIDATKVILNANKTLSLLLEKVEPLFIRLRGVDEQNRLSLPSQSKDFNTFYLQASSSLPIPEPSPLPSPLPPPPAEPPSPPPPIEVPPTEAVPPTPVVEEGTLKQKVEKETAVIPQEIKPSPFEFRDPDYLNSHVFKSRVGLEGGLLTMLSQDQILARISNPTILSWSLKISHWMKEHGFHFSVKSKVAEVTNPDQQDLNPLQTDLQYRYRWMFNANPFSSLKKMEFSLIGGLEFYKNPGRGLYSSGYNLLKTGFSLNFPLGQRWFTGGEVLYGQAPDSSAKLEISGNLGLFYSENLSFSAGYRIHLFNAASEALTPLGVLPYREGSAEGFGGIQWHY